MGVHRRNMEIGVVAVDPVTDLAVRPDRQLWSERRRTRSEAPLGSGYLGPMACVFFLAPELGGKSLGS